MMSPQIAARFIKSCFVLISAVTATCLSLACFAQEKSTLPYVSDSADVIMVTRPAAMMTSDDYRDLKRKGGKHLDKVVGSITDSYFDFSLAEIHEIEQIIYATSIPDQDLQMTREEMYNVMILTTTKDNTTGFDMVTQDVEEILEYKGNEYFQFKKPVNYMYQYAFIADEKTIVWSGSKLGVERSIDAGTKGPQSADWYKQWREFSDKPCSMSMKVKPIMLSGMPPDLAAFKDIQMVAGGADVARQTKVKARAVCKNEADAQSAVAAIKQGLEMAKQAMEAQKKAMKNSGQEATFSIIADLINATKVKAVRQNVEIESVIDIDFDKLVPMFEAGYQAAARTEAANNLRQTVIALHNYHDANKKLPASVMVSENGKKYSWRIAILPYIEEKELYDQYDFSQDWNSPHNREVTSRMPDVFRSGVGDKESTNTAWFLLNGADGVVDGENSKTLQELSNADGTAGTILAVEAKRNVHWAKPEDIQVDPKRGLPKFGGFFEGGFNAAMGDGSVRFISDKVAPEVLWQFYTADGGEAIDPAALEVDDK